jgi:hypothetical protein
MEKVLFIDRCSLMLPTRDYFFYKMENEDVICYTKGVF